MLKGWMLRACGHTGVWALKARSAERIQPRRMSDLPAAAGKSDTPPETPVRCAAQLNRQRISVEFLLVPVRVNQRHGAGGVELLDLIGRQVPTDRTEIVAQLSLVTRADNDRCDGRPLKQPIDRYLSDRFPVSAATSLSASTTLKRWWSVTFGPISCERALRWRLTSGSGCPRRIFPVRRPQPSGLQTTVPIFWSRLSGINSHSYSWPMSE